jgi:hypothetical protein
MRPVPRSIVVLTAAVAVTAAVARPVAQQGATTPPVPPTTPAATATAPAVTITPELFSGFWDYNALDSVNAANGRPEQNPQSATQRRTPNGGRPADRPGTGSGTVYPPGGAPPVGWGNGGNPNGGGYGMPNPNPPGPRMGPALITSLLKDLARDLLEIPESLSIKVTPEAVTFTDDLDRELTYATNGKKQKQQIGAAVFDARTTWDGVQLKKNISAAEGFKMTETYFLSTDAQRLFVIIRLGEQRKGAPVVGVNRVYDRVSSLPASAGGR